VPARADLLRAIQETQHRYDTEVDHQGLLLAFPADTLFYMGSPALHLSRGSCGKLPCPELQCLRVGQQTHFSRSYRSGWCH
jgi:hypothetical protein